MDSQAKAAPFLHVCEKKPAVALKMDHTLQSKMHACFNLARWDSACTEMWPFTHRRSL